MGQQYKYDFSVVMAVYNVEPYLREAVESLVHQTIGFSRIQLIMVDDGSTDKSGEICDEYLEKFPENVVVIHKENGGVSSARNAGLNHIKGRYLNFMDSDDKFAIDAFQKVLAFFSKHRTETDVVAVPLIFFDGQKGEHPQNRKFRLDSDLLDLFENTDITNFNASASFVITKSVGGLTFDERLTIAEDAKYMMAVLLKKMKLGLVADTCYYYRKRSSGEKSATQSSIRKREWYLPSLKYFSRWALDTAKQQYGAVPRFIQNEVMYDLQWKIRLPEIPAGVLSENEKKEFKKYLLDITCKIDDEVIKNQKRLYVEHFVYLFRRKYDREPELNIVEAELGNRDIELRIGNVSVGSTSVMRSFFEFLSYDSEKDCFVIEGYHILVGLEGHRVSPYLEINGKQIICLEVDRSQKAMKILGDTVTQISGFRAEIPSKIFMGRIVSGIIVDGVSVIRKNIGFGRFFPVSSVYNNAYALCKGRMVVFRRKALEISPKPGKIHTLVQECRFLKEIWRKNLLGGRKAVFGRLYYNLMKLFKRRKLWLISDRIMKADDNGEALFCYLRKHTPKNTRIVFAINKNSPDYKRIAEIGPCVSAMSFHHKLLHLLCDVNISAQADWVTVNPFEGHSEALRDLLTHQRFVFLQHGITKDDISGWLNRYEKDISGFVTAAYREYKSIVEGDYAYPASRIWLTGFPRYDRLYHNEEKVVTVMPTWRQYLMSGINGREGTWNPSEGYAQSEYCLFYNKLLNSKRLLNALDHYGYRLQFFPHPNTQPAIHCFHRNEKVVFLPLNSSYRDVYARSQLVVTDYSSAVFDFAYLRKPVLYCQFDRERVFAGEHVTRQGYFDYEKDGFGEVTYDLDSLVDLIIWYVKNGCMLKDLYRKRIDDFFAFNDQNSCKRVTEKILAMPDKE